MECAGFVMIEGIQMGVVNKALQQIHDLYDCLQFYISYPPLHTVSIVNGLSAILYCFYSQSNHQFRYCQDLFSTKFLRYGHICMAPCANCWKHLQMSLKNSVAEPQEDQSSAVCCDGQHLSGVGYLGSAGVGMQ